MHDLDNVEVLKEEYGLPSQYVEHLKQRSIERLWQPQVESMNSGLLGDNNFLMVSPPGTGKTLAAEFVIMEEFIQNRDMSIFLVPYKSLAKEKYDDFVENLGNLGLEIKKSVGGGSKEKSELLDADIAVMTYEKFDYYLRNHKSFLDGVGCVVIDELQKINEEKRGPYLEISITRINENFPDTRIVGLSATTPNVEELANWLDADFNNCEWQKNEVVEGICINESRQINFYTEEGTKVEDVGHYTGSYKTDSILDFIRDEKQSLVFANKRETARETAKKISDYVQNNPKSYPVELEKRELEAIEERIEKLPYSQGSNLRKVRKYVKHGVGLHHAGLPRQVKNLIQEGFEEGHIKAIVATSTLAAGVNLPVDRIFVLKPRLGGKGENGTDLSTSQYKNLVGRSGRPNYTDTCGEAVLFSETELTSESLRTNYINGVIEPIMSRIDLSTDPDILLNLLQDNPDIDEIIDFMEGTLKGHKQEIDEDNLENDVEISLEVLESLEMIERQGSEFKLTETGESVSRKLIEPRTAHLILSHLEESDEISEKFLLANIISSPELENMRLWLERGKHYTKREEFRDKFGMSHFELREMDKILATMFTISSWIQGEKLSEYMSENPIDNQHWGVADIRDRISPTISRILTNIIEITEESKPELHEEYSEELKELKMRVKHGLSQKQVPYAQKSVCYNRNLIRHLQNSGFEKPKDITDLDIYSAPLQLQQAIKLKNRAINSFFSGREWAKRKILLKAQEEHKDQELYKNMLESDKTDFEDYALEILSKLSNLSVRKVDESGRVNEPEAYGKIEQDQEYVNDENGRVYKIGIECKTTENLSGDVGADKSVQVTTKAPDANLKVTFGNPGFTDSAIDAAKKNDVLLIDSVVLAEISLQDEISPLSPEDLNDVFSGKGLLTSDSLDESVLY